VGALLSLLAEFMHSVRAPSQSPITQASPLTQITPQLRMVVIAITGATGDVGYETCKQISAVAEVTKLIVTARTEAKAGAVVAKLVKDTGKDRAWFDYVVLDLSDHASVMAAVQTFPQVDRLCLNAGGLSDIKTHKQSGTTDAIVSNVLGHSVLSDELLKSGKINAGGRIIYIGSEVTRPVLAYAGLLPMYCSFREGDLEWAMTKTYWDCSTPCLKVRSQLGDYKNAKIIGHLFYAAVAKEQPDLHTLIVSPGAVGGSFASDAYFPMNCLLWAIPSFFICIGANHKLETGVARYIDGVLTGEPKWAAGSMPMSKPNWPCNLPCSCLPCTCLFGANSPDMVDNRPFAPYLHDDALNEKAAAMVREYQKKWAASSPSPAVIERG